MALFLGTGTDISSIYPQGEHYDKLKEAVVKNYIIIYSINDGHLCSICTTEEYTSN